MKEYEVEVSGMCYLSPGDGADRDVVTTITESELSELRRKAEEQGCELDEVWDSDLPRTFVRRMEEALRDAEWEVMDDMGFMGDSPVEKDDINVKINGFRIFGADEQ